MDMNTNLNKLYKIYKGNPTTLKLLPLPNSSAKMILANLLFYKL